MTTPAAAAFANGTGYGYYPGTMIQLCADSYLPLQSIAATVAALGWQVAWGPAELVADEESYSLAFIASRTAPGLAITETVLVVRGTNFESLKTWVDEDFKVASTVPFATVVPGAPAAAVIARGTYNGLEDLLQLRDPVTQVSLTDFVTGMKPTVLYVTGHSLGGTLAPPVFAMLKARLADTAMGMWTFAGLTPGNTAFNDYLAGLIDFPYPWRLHNTLDAAPLCWGDLHEVEGLYGPAYQFGVADRLALDLFLARTAGRAYAQPGAGLALPGALQPEAGHLEWAKEAAYQHHPATYQQLVTQAYPQAEE